ncbi:MAG: Cytochrome d ubiquinol oxidase subunit I [Ktedonobacterales bacterium]|jgi:cytochrome d ubiquinol oxidase subunit I|nr:MAG: Cytochrome d ubiquinol oxidase subunit I [Ktedonobacterales bacterium]
MSSDTAARASLGVSLAFHIVFAAVSIGLPLMFCIAEGIGLRRRDATWYILARRWSRASGILFVVGAVSGTALSFEFGLLWPRFMGFASGIVGLMFTFEGVAFFIEAIFLGLYLYGWDRLSPRTHWLCSIPVVISAALASQFIVAVNSWMNTPTGFQLVNGKAVNIDPFAAMFNPAAPAQALHMLIAAYQVTGFTVAAVYAVGLLRKRKNPYHIRGVQLGMILATVMVPLQAIVGSWIGEMIARQQPEKLAGLESLFHTTTGAPLTLFGWPDASTQQIYFGIAIPKLLSLLSFNNPNATVTGLDAYAQNTWPSLPITHLAFDTMATLGGLFLLVPILFWGLYYWKKRTVPTARWFLWVLVISGPLTFVALEAGWVAAELGRQPWVIYNIMRTSDGSTTNPGVGFFFFIFLAIYLALGVASAGLLLRLARERKTFVPEKSSLETSQPVSGEPVGVES